MKNIKNNLKVLGIILLIACIFGFIGYQIRGEVEKNKAEDSFGVSESDVVNVIGTASAPYRFSDDSGASAHSTTTEVIYVGDDVNVLDLNINVIEASSSPDVMIMVEQSNDASCVSDSAAITWVDASPTDTTAKTTTTTHPFSLDAGHGGKFQITNWNGSCARISVGSASSTVWVSASKQQLNR